MRIGFTYDLRDEYLNLGFSPEQTAEFDSLATIDAIETALNSPGHEVVRIGNIRNLCPKLANGDRWDLVFNIAEGIYGFGREAQIPALLDAYGIPYTFSDPLVLSVCLHKGFTKHIARDFQIPTPDFNIVYEESDVTGISLPYPLFLKPVTGGTGVGIDSQSVIRDKTQLTERCRLLLQRYKQPVLVERFLPGREYTVGILGTEQAARAIGCLEIRLKAGSDKKVYSYRNKEFCEELVEYCPVERELAERAERLVLEVWRCFGCRDAGRVDFREDHNGCLSFLEVNPLAGLHPTHSDLPIICQSQGMSYRELIQGIIHSAGREAIVLPDAHASALS
ncbi:MAG: ATP-grasp domain-containing protein [Spirochaeta sp.]|nr:ATP-grasp domain-containing protein [Spirochaeta sp.]